MSVRRRPRTEPLLSATLGARGKELFSGTHDFQHTTGATSPDPPFSVFERYPPNRPVHAHALAIDLHPPAPRHLWRRSIKRALESPRVPHPPVASPFIKPMAPAVLGEYAMWWWSNLEPAPGASQTLEAIDRAYDALDGIHSYVLAALLKPLGKIEEAEDRVRLPHPGGGFQVQGPDGRVLVLSVMEEKGIRLHLHTQSTPVPYRDWVWRLFAEFAESWRGWVIANDLPHDLPSLRFSSPKDHWAMVRRSVQEMVAERNTRDMSIGNWGVR